MGTPKDTAIDSAVGSDVQRLATLLAAILFVAAGCSSPKGAVGTPEKQSASSVGSDADDSAIVEEENGRGGGAATARSAADETSGGTSPLTDGGGRTDAEPTRLESGVAEAKKIEPPVLSNPALLDPKLAQETAPDIYRVRFETTKGAFVIEVTREWSPLGADRFYNLVKIDFYNDTAFFRVIKNFIVQFGISGEPVINQVWRELTLKDEEVLHSNLRGYVSFAKLQNPDSRTTQIFINLADRNRFLDKLGFPPFGRVVEGLEVVDSLYAGYGGPEDGGPRQEAIRQQGNRYLNKLFPKMDYVIKAEIVE